MELLRFDPAKKMDLILLGRVAIDFNPVDMNRPLEESAHFNKYLGGSPANIAVGMARQGKKIGFVGKVSDDSFGDFVVHYFEKEGIDVSHLSRAAGGEKLGLTFTEIKSPSESSILMYRNGAADLALTPQEVEEGYLCQAKALLVSGTALSESPSREAALKATLLAKKNGLPVIFDIDYRPYSWKNMDEISVYCALAAEKADLILGSREEFDLTERLCLPAGLEGADEEGDTAALDKGRGYSGQGQTPRRRSPDQRSSAYWQSKGAKIVIIKHGKEGSSAYTCEGECYRVRPFSANVLKGFGGGDGYASSFLRALLDGCSLERALEYGAASAAMLVSAHSCSAAMPTLPEVEEFIRREKESHGEVVSREVW